MRKFLKIIGGLFLFGIAIFAFVMFLTSGQRDVARNFVTHASSGDYTAAHDLLHSALQDEFPIAKFETDFADVKPYIEVSFGGIESATGSATKLTGTATTADGCKSEVAFRVLDDKIVSFNITPLCRK